MRIDARLIIVAALLAAQPVASGEAGRPVAVTVTFGPALESKLGASYGTEEAEVLRACVVRSVGEALEQRRGGRPGTPAASIAVVITDAQPSHPTRRQRSDNPSLDPLRSVSLGGADLNGTVRAADGRVLATVSHRHFAPNFELASPAGDAWADARVAIQQWAADVVARIAAGR